MPPTNPAPITGIDPESTKSDCNNKSGSIGRLLAPALSSDKEAMVLGEEERARGLGKALGDPDNLRPLGDT